MPQLHLFMVQCLDLLLLGCSTTPTPNLAAVRVAQSLLTSWRDCSQARSNVYADAGRATRGTPAAGRTAPGGSQHSHELQRLIRAPHIQPVTVQPSSLAEQAQMRSCRPALARIQQAEKRGRA